MSLIRFGERVFEAELVIFDKDGTLTDFRKTWIPIIDKRLEIILSEIDTTFHPERIRAYAYEVFGIFNDYIDPYGPFPYSTPWEDEIIFGTILYRFGIPWQKAKDVARFAIDKAEEELDRAKFAVLYNGVRKVLEDLRKARVFIALATADITEIAVDTLKHVGIFDLFDFVVGADMVENDKPNPDMIDKTVQVLNVDKKKAVMVGDSITDMEMGKRAGVGLVVGVLEGGIAAKEDLLKFGDEVINSVRDIEVLK